MSRHKHVYAVERFRGHPDALAAELEALGVRLKHAKGYMPCLTYRDSDGDLVREVGEVCVIVDGVNAGQVHVWPFSDATARERIILLRTAEEVQLGRHEDDKWKHRQTSAGVNYRRTVVMVILEEGDAAYDSAVARLPESVWSAQERHCRDAQDSRS